jgi:hypothetical protein
MLLRRVKKGPLYGFTSMARLLPRKRRRVLDRLVDWMSLISHT